MKTIKLTQGYEAMVSDEDFERVNQYKWHVYKDKYTCYARRRTQKNGVRTNVFMHRFILDTMSMVDHRDRNGLNNQRENLRIADWFKNAWNREVRRDSKTGVKGVGISTDRENKKFYAYITHHGKVKHLGRYHTLEEARIVREEAEKKYFGEFANSSD